MECGRRLKEPPASKESDDFDGDLLTISNKQSDEAWILDTLSSYHVTPKQKSA